MSKYTTGEIAKLCGVTVRTVQYYDTRNILVPSELTEGGRRLYSEEDLEQMKIICFLRNIGLSIDQIKEILLEEHPANIISLLLKQQESVLQEEIAERKEKLALLEGLTRNLKVMESFSVQSIGDVAYIMKHKEKLHKLHMIMIALGVPLKLIEVGTLVLGLLTGLWWPFAIGLVVVLTLELGIARYHYKNTAYICSECHSVFQPNFREALFASHTPRTRKLTCPTCGHKGFCVETYGKED